MAVNPNPISRDRQLAILLHTLGEEAIGPALSALPPEAAAAVRQHLKQFDQQPPRPEQVESTFDDFENFFRFAIETLNLTHETTTRLEQRGLNATESAGGKAQLKIFEPSDDAVADLRQLEPPRLAAALADERPRTIALALTLLERNAAAQTIEHLPPELQTETFILLKQTSDPAPQLVQEIARSTVNKALQLSADDLEKPDMDQELAQLLRELPKKTRSRLVTEIKEKDEDTAARLQELLYVFDDIALYEDRSIQKILGVVETSTLVIALQDADEAIRDAIYRNLSKRARQALEEEIAYASRSSEDEVLQARKEIAAALGQLDQAGELMLAEGGS